MINVYLVRHGESVANKERRSHIPDDSLSVKGTRQAKAVAKRFKDIPIDLVYASPFTRARQTAEYISKELNKPIEFWEDLRERKRPSEGEGKSLDDPVVVKIDEILKKNRHKNNFKYSDDESYDELMLRAKKVTDHLLKKHKSQNILCVSHAGLIKFITAYVLFGNKLPARSFWDYYYHSWLANTGITHIEYTKKYGWGLLTWNDVTHL